MSFIKMIHHEARKSQQYKARQHLKHPIPYPMEVMAIGKTLTKMEWDKFSQQHLNAKMRLNCERNHNGTLIFIGERGFEALTHFQEKFANRFHLRMICANQILADQWLKLAIDNTIQIEELHYRNEHGLTVKSQLLH